MTCSNYRTLFLEVALEFPEAQFSWIDVEDHADLVDAVEVEDFPTLLILLGTHVCFFGAVTPHRQTLRRLLQACQNSDSAPTAHVDAHVRALAQRLA